MPVRTRELRGKGLQVPLSTLLIIVPRRYVVSSVRRSSRTIPYGLRDRNVKTDVRTGSANRTYVKQGKAAVRQLKVETEKLHSSSHWISSCMFGILITLRI